MIELDDVKVRAIYGGSAVEVEEGSDLSDGGDGEGGSTLKTDGTEAAGVGHRTGRVKPWVAQPCEVGMWEMF